MTKTLKWIFSLALVATLLLYFWSWAISKRPKGVNVSPVSEIELKPGCANVDTIAHRITGDFTLRDDIGYRLLIFGPPDGDTVDGVYRTINILQFDTHSLALSEYADYLRIFTDRSEAWKLYDSNDRKSDKYFVSYQTVRLDYNHGIPCGIIRSPHILIAYLKNNLLVTVSYTGYRNHENYIEDINRDVRYVAELLRDCLAAQGT